MTKTAVVALGGNALTRLGQSGTSEEMAANAAAMAASVNDVIEAGWRVASPALLAATMSPASGQRAGTRIERCPVRQ